MPTMMPRFLVPCLCLTAFSLANAEVVRVEVTERSDVANTGYEQIVGRLHFEIDPAHPRNRIIADADLAPKNAAGRVAFSSDFRILKPKDAVTGHGDCPDFRGNDAKMGLSPSAARGQVHFPKRKMSQSPLAQS